MMRQMCEPFLLNIYIEIRTEKRKISFMICRRKLLLISWNIIRTKCKGENYQNCA